MSKGSNMPQKRMVSSVKFEEPVVCSLRLSLQGKKVEDASDTEKKESTIPSCDHPIWPTIFPQCVGCLAHNKHERYMKDTKGREYRVIK